MQEKISPAYCLITIYQTSKNQRDDLLISVVYLAEKTDF